MFLFYLGPKLQFLFIGINIILTIVIVFLERKNPQSTYAWLLFLWMIPILGFVFYWFLSQNLTRRKIYKYDTPLDIAYHQMMKKTLPPAGECCYDIQLYERHSNPIAYFQNVHQAYFSGNNHIEIFTDGHDKFVALINDIANAKSSVHLEYYIIKNDALANRIIDLLIKKAGEGLEVRLLFDEMGGRYIPKSRLKELEAAGGEWGVFFPSRLLVNIRVNYRDHRKIVVIDGLYGYVGGFNIGDEYLGLNKKMGYWRDTHIKITGTAVHELQHRFLLDWETSGKHGPLTNPKVQLDFYYPPVNVLQNYAGIQIVSSGPDDPNEVIKHGYVQMINDATHHVYIHTPYFIPDSSISEALRIAALSGIDVRIMIPNKPDHIFIYWATLSFVGELIEAGVKVYIYQNGFLHSKTITVDDEMSVVGSCNFDIRSFSLNFETSAFIYDRNTAIKLREAFEADMLKSDHYDTEQYQNRSKWLKIKESVSRLFAPVL